MQAAKVTVSTSATLLAAKGGDVGYPQAVLVSNPTGGATVFLGGSTVNTTQGFPLLAGAAVSVDASGEELYGIVAASTQDVNVLKRTVA